MESLLAMVGGVGLIYLLAQVWSNTTSTKPVVIPDLTPSGHSPWNFSIVRCLCQACGWERVIGYTGKYDGSRAIIRVRPDKSDCNILRSTMIVGPDHLSIKDLSKGFSDFHDLREESSLLGMNKVKEQFDSYFLHHNCPRCKKRSTLGLDWLRSPYIKYSRFKSWRQYDMK